MMTNDKLLELVAQAPRVAGKGDSKMNKLQALNSLEIVDADCYGGEVEYILAEVSAANIKILLDAGFTAEQIDEAMSDDKNAIDLTTLAFNYTDAVWWSSASGFTAQAGEGGQDESPEA